MTQVPTMDDVIRIIDDKIGGLGGPIDGKDISDELRVEVLKYARKDVTELAKSIEGGAEYVAEYDPESELVHLVDGFLDGWKAARGERWL